MPNRWITFVKQWASDHNLAYGCALSKPELKAAYNKEYPKAIKLPKGVKKLEESRPPADVKSKMTFRNLAIRIPEDNEADDNDYNSQADTVVMSDIESDNKPPPASEKKKRGRPQKYKSEDEVYKAKLESNKLKRREARAEKAAAPVAAPAEPVAEKPKTEKNIAYYEAKLKEAQDWKKKYPDASADLIERANNNIRRANESIAKLKAATPAEKVDVSNLSKNQQGIFELLFDRVLETIEHFEQFKKMKEADKKALMIYGQIYNIIRFRKQFKAPKLANDALSSRLSSLDSDWSRRMKNIIEHKTISKKNLDFFAEKAYIAFPPAEMSSNPIEWIPEHFA